VIIRVALSPTLVTTGFFDVREIIVDVREIIFACARSFLRARDHFCVREIIFDVREIIFDVRGITSSWAIPPYLYALDVPAADRIPPCVLEERGELANDRPPPGIRARVPERRTRSHDRGRMQRQLA
jgi:hypothetical protein